MALLSRNSSCYRSGKSYPIMNDINRASPVLLKMEGKGKVKVKVPELMSGRTLCAL